MSKQIVHNYYKTDKRRQSRDPIIHFYEDFGMIMWNARKWYYTRYQ